jgi:hypothetical protein
MSPAWVGPLRTGTSGLGDTAAPFPAGGGPVRETRGASRTEREAARERRVGVAPGSEIG